MDDTQVPSHDDQVRAALDRVIASSVFSGSPMLIRFLRFVVEQTLAGRADALKEYTIAVGALGKSAQFDPTNDSTVRVAARQLRFKLSEYFADHGHDDSIIIELPKGRYVPTFLARSAAAPLPIPDSVAPTASVAAPAMHRRGRHTWALVGFAAVVGITIVGLLGNRIRDKRLAADAPRDAATAAAAVVDAPSRIPTLVVLPFLNLTGSADDDYVADGIAEEITTTLARSSDLRIISRTSAFKYKGTTKDVRVIATDLAANAVIEGSIRKTNAEYRVSVKLIDARDGVHLWAQTFTVSRRNFFTLYDEVARAVANETNARLHGTVRPMPPRTALLDPEAHLLYLEARYHWNKRVPASVERSVRLYQQAIARDSTYAMAYAGLADSYATMAVNSISLPGVSPPKAVAAAQRALALDSTLGEPHAALALMRAFQDWDWDAADREFATAMRLNPNYATAHSWYAITLVARGRFDETLAELAIAQRLDPLSLAIGYNTAEALYYARRWSSAEQKVTRLLALDSTFGPAHVLLGRIYALTNRPALARQSFLRGNDSIAFVQMVESPDHVVKLRAKMRRLPAEVVRRAPTWMGMLHASLADNDSAFLWLERAYHARHLDLVSLRVDPVFDRIRQDPRYTNLLQRMGLN